MTRRWSFALAVVLLAALHAAADEGAQDWIKRILDPTTLGVTPYPASTLNRKLSVDTIRYDKDPAKRTAVYTAPLDQLKAIAAHFEKTLGVAPEKRGPDSKGYDKWIFTVTPGHGPAAANGLTIAVMRSPWVDDMAQIDMNWVAPAK